MKRLMIFLAGVLIACSMGTRDSLSAQESNTTRKYDLAVADIMYQKVHKDWLRVPKSVDLKVTWTVKVKSDSLADESARNPADFPLVYKTYLYEGEDPAKEIAVKETRDADFAVFKNVAIGRRISIKVVASDTDGNHITESGLASMVIGKETIQDDEFTDRSLLYYAHPGRWQLAIVGKADIYDRSTMLGKLAFMFLSVTSLLSFVILIFYSSRILYLGNIFPYQRSPKNLIWSLALSCDTSYDNRLTNKFKFILKAWEMIATKSKVVADQAVKSIPSSLSSTEKMASVDVACMEYWTNDGDRAIGTIEDIISFPDYHAVNGKPKSADDLLTELVIKIEDNFHELLHDSSNSTNGNGLPKANGKNGTMNGHHQKEDIKRLIEEIYEPVVMDQKRFRRLSKLVLRKGVIDMKKGLRPFPTSRIIHAGLKIHRMSGYRWSKPIEDVRRAFEDRASNEIETLKRKSRIEWFWNYGALAPLVGLFGTVTGITYAFQQLAQTNATPDFVSTIQNLSNGIFEALWTTIFGLVNGILFVIVYYYFKHKLDWIYSKWEETYVTITEKL